MDQIQARKKVGNTDALEQIFKRRRRLNTFG